MTIVVNENHRSNCLIQELILRARADGAGGGDSDRGEPSFPLPMDQVFYKFNTHERRTLYDYVVEVGPHTQSVLASIPHTQSVLASIPSHNNLNCR